MLKIHIKPSNMGIKLLAVAVLCVGLVTGFMQMPQAKAAGLALDALVTKQQTSPSNTIIAPNFSTAQQNELVLAFIASDGPGGKGVQQISNVTSGGLTWTLRKRVNAPGTGTSEIWQAVAKTPVKDASVKATRANGSYVGLITIASFTGANLSQNGAVGGASAKSGGASAQLTTTRPNSWVWGVGNDWDAAAARTLGANQTKVSEVVNTSVGDTQWVQRQTNSTTQTNTSVILNTVAPNRTPWNLATIEILSAGTEVAIPPAPSITSPVANALINNTRPTFTGNGQPSATVTLTVDTLPSFTALVDTNGNWTYTPEAHLSDGSHTAKAMQTDSTGAISPVSAVTSFTVDTTVPRVIVNQKTTQADPTTENRAVFTIEFSEEIVSGIFTSADLKITGSTGTVTSLMQLTPTTWEAIVTGMTDGDKVSASLDAGLVADRAGNLSQPSTSTDNSVTYEAPTTPTSAGSGWQLTAANTGLAPHGLSCDLLPEYTGPAKVPAGTTISKQRITKSLVLADGGVTIERSCFKPTSSDYTMVQTFDNDACDNSGCYAPRALSVIRDSEFDGSRLDSNPSETYNRAHVTAFKGIATLQRNYAHDVGSGFAITASGTQLDALVEQNYITGLKSWGDGGTTGTHSEAFTIRDFDGTKKADRVATIRNNRFNCDGGNESGAFFIQAMGNINNVTIEGNLLEGDNYQLTLGIWNWASPGTSYSNMKAINNRFSGTGYGAVNNENGPGWSVWQNNYYNNWSAANNQGAPVK